MQETRFTTAEAERMTIEHYTELIDLLHEKINRLERDNDEKRKEINRLKNEIRGLKKQAAEPEQDKTTTEE